MDIDRVGTRHYADLPGYVDTSARSDLDPLAKDLADPDEPVTLSSRGDRPPPMVDVWG